MLRNEKLRLAGAPSIRIYGLEIAEWQRRNWDRAGVAGAEGTICAATAFVLSSGLARALVANPGMALVEQRGAGLRLIAAHLATPDAAAAVEALIAAADADEATIQALGLAPHTADELTRYAYNLELRKRETPFAVDLETDGVRAAEKALFDSSYKGVTDFVTKYAWPVPAFAVTRFCAARKISPNTVTTLSLIFVFVAMWFFWHGQWALGFASAWFMTFLDTVDGKLARTTLTSSKWGNVYDHGIDLIHPPFWYYAWLKGIEATTATSVGAAPPAWLDAAFWIVVFLYVFGRLIEGLFIKAHGFHIHVWRPVDSFMRVYTARRNPNTFIFMAFCIVGAPVAGFAAMTAWTVFCNLFHTVRLAQAGLKPAEPPLTSWMDA